MGSEHTGTSPHLFLAQNTYLCSAAFVVSITHQHDNDRIFKIIFYACYFVGLLVIM